MRFTTTLASLSALVLGASAAAIRQNDPHITDFRTYGEPGCFNQNQGVYTLTQSQLGACREFVDPVVGSMFVTDITTGCYVYIYTDKACIANQVMAPVGIDRCYNYPAGLGSYKVVCPAAA